MQMNTKAVYYSRKSFTENDCVNCEKIFEKQNNLEAYEKMCLGKTGTKKRQKKRPGNKETKILSQETVSSRGDF